MKVKDLLAALERHDPDASLRFSVADDDSEDAGERWFVEDGIEDCFDVGGEVTICLVGKSNLSSE